LITPLCPSIICTFLFFPKVELACNTIHQLLKG
jgi:hypothetical protein